MCGLFGVCVGVFAFLFWCCYGGNNVKLHQGYNGRKSWWFRMQMIDVDYWHKGGEFDWRFLHLSKGKCRLDRTSYNSWRIWLGK